MRRRKECRGVDYPVMVYIVVGDVIGCRHGGCCFFRYVRRKIIHGAKSLISH